MQLVDTKAAFGTIPKVCGCKEQNKKKAGCC